MWEVEVFDSPVGEFSGPIYAKPIYSPGTEENYKSGDRVKLLITLTYDTLLGRYTDADPSGSNVVLGKYNAEAPHNLKPWHLNSKPDRDNVRFVNDKSQAGIIIDDYGNVVLSSNGFSNLVVSSGGFGINKECLSSYAQNFSRIVAGNAPFYLVKEHFGMYSGSDDDDEVSRTSPDDNQIVFRRFVTQTQDPENWVSLCEGTWAPYVGANNNSEEISLDREVLYTRIINHGDSRVTIEGGEPGASFLNIRVDNVTMSEQNAEGAAPGATPGTVGNKFKINVSDEGAVELFAAGAGTPQSNTYGVHISIDTDGNLKIHSKGTIELSHGDNDTSNNSIVMDPISGIDMTAKNGLRFNGQEVVLKAFLDWMQQNQSQLCQVTSIGGPAPIHPAALPAFTSGINKFADQKGFTSNNSGEPAAGIINNQDNFQTV